MWRKDFVITRVDKMYEYPNTLRGNWTDGKRFVDISSSSAFVGNRARASRVGFWRARPPCTNVGHIFCAHGFGREKFLLTDPRTKLIAGKKAFYAAAVRIWNSLPTSLRQCSTTEKLKKALKFHLFPNDELPSALTDAIVFILPILLALYIMFNLFMCSILVVYYII